MGSTDQLRLMAAQLLIRAARETDPCAQADYELMAQSYLQLADLAEQNSKTDVIHETPSASSLRKQ